MSWELFFFFEEGEKHSGKEAKKEEIENWSNGDRTKLEVTESSEVGQGHRKAQKINK